MQTMVPLYGFGGGGGSGATLTVTAPAGATVTVSKDGKTKTKVANSSSVAVFKGLATGQWTVTITDGEQTAQKTVTVTADYSTAITLFSATIHVTYPAGSTCTATDGVTTLTAPDTSGAWDCVVPNAGTWTISAGEAKATVEMVDNGSEKTVDIKYADIAALRAAMATTNFARLSTSSGDKCSCNGRYFTRLSSEPVIFTTTKSANNYYGYGVITLTDNFGADGKGVSYTCNDYGGLYKAGSAVTPNGITCYLCVMEGMFPSEINMTMNLAEGSVSISSNTAASCTISASEVGLIGSEECITQMYGFIDSIAQLTKG